MPNFGGGFGRGKDGQNTAKTAADGAEDTSSTEKKQRPSGGTRPDFGGELPGDFDPSQFGGGFPNGGKTKPGDSNNETEETDTQGETSDGQDGTFPSRGDQSGESRPQMNGGFPGMSAGESADNPGTYILLGASALVLLLGIGFALKFKR